MYQWLVFLHVLGVFGFLLAHGVSVFVAFRVQREKDVHAIRALLGLSASAVMMSTFSLLLILVAGIIAGFMGNWWSMGWIWAALGVFVVVWILMSRLHWASVPQGAHSGGVHRANHHRRVHRL